MTSVNANPYPQQYLGRRYAPDEPLPVTQGIIDYEINRHRTQQGRMATVAILQNMINNGKIYGNFVLPDPTEV